MLTPYKNELAALRILAEACDEIEADIALSDIEATKRSDILRRAMRYLVRGLRFAR